MTLETPVVLIIFRRPELTQQVFEQIAAAQPRQLFIIADGPRNPREAERCAAARAVVETIDWPCEVHRNYADENMGLRRRISSGMDWVFEHVECAIVLEDDCVPHPTFFRFCEKLLKYYAHDEQVMSITGDNFGYQRSPSNSRDSYFFTRYPHTWGWATWRRAWAKYDVTMAAWHDPDKRHLILGRSPWWMRSYWTRIYHHVDVGIINTWDYQWLLTHILHDGLVATPYENLVTHIGVGEGASNFEHSRGHETASFRPVKPVQFPLHHPEVRLNHAAEAYISRFTWVNYGQFFPLRVYRKARALLKG